MTRAYTIRVQYFTIAELVVKAPTPAGALKRAQRIFEDGLDPNKLASASSTLHMLETTDGDRQHHLFPTLAKRTKERTSNA